MTTSNLSSHSGVVTRAMARRLRSDRAATSTTTTTTTATAGTTTTTTTATTTSTGTTTTITTTTTTTNTEPTFDETTLLEDNDFQHIAASSSPPPQFHRSDFSRMLATTSSIIRPYRFDIQTQIHGSVEHVLLELATPKYGSRRIQGFYTNPISWSSTNLLAVGTRDHLTVVNTTTGADIKLDEIGANNPITCVSWMKERPYLAVATANGTINVWDVRHERVLRTYGRSGHPIYAMTWCGSVLDSGERGENGGRIMRRDIRAPDIEEERYFEHTSDVCCLHWNRANTYQVSGSMNGHLLLWDKYSTFPFRHLNNGCDAIKAAAWSPHRDDLLVVGDDSKAGKIRLWDVTNSYIYSRLETKSKVSNLAWLPHNRGILSTHICEEGNIRLWEYPELMQPDVVTEMGDRIGRHADLDLISMATGHDNGVSYLTTSPDGNVFATSAPNKSLSLWEM